MQEEALRVMGGEAQPWNFLSFSSYFSFQGSRRALFLSLHVRIQLASKAFNLYQPLLTRCLQVGQDLPTTGLSCLCPLK